MKRLALAVVVALVSVYATYPPLQILTNGVDYAAQGRFEEAKEEFEKALRASPFLGSARDSLTIIDDLTQKKITREVAIHYFKGATHVLKEQWDEGITQYDKVLEVNPRYAIAYRTRGFARCCKGKYDQAISDFTKAVELNPRYADAYFLRGVAYCSKGKYDQAISDFSKAIEINPRHAMAFSNRGAVHAEKGQNDKAISDCTKAIEINPRDAFAHYNRGTAHYLKGEHYKSYKDVHKAQSLGYPVPPEILKALRKAIERQI
jgi:tetratricopeptide (TPR) repeat protein